MEGNGGRGLIETGQVLAQTTQNWEFVTPGGTS